MVDAEHVTAEGIVRHYHGYAVPMFSKLKTLIWFQMKSHLRGHIHIGPVKWDVRPPTIARLVPRVGTVIFGKVGDPPRGNGKNRVFKWWSSQGEPVLEFVRLLVYKGRGKKIKENVIFKSLLFFRHRPCFHCRECKHPVYTQRYQDEDHPDHQLCRPCLICGHEMLEACSCPPCKTFWPCEDLWVIYKIITGNDFSTPLKILTLEQHGHNNIPGQCRSVSKGIHMSYDPIRFVFMLAWFSRSVYLFEKFVSKIGSIKQAYPQRTKNVLSDYSLQSLDRLLYK